jgi:group I intron endonuclease
MKTGIYAIKNLANGKVYVGQSVNLDKRKQNHFWALEYGNHFNSHLQKAFNKYGKNNFEFHILEETEEGLLDVQERLWIKHYKSNRIEFGYNRDDGGSVHKHFCSESRKKCLRQKWGHVVHGLESIFL